MTWKPEEFHGLSKAEAEEMKELHLSRVDYDRHRLCVAHGDLCASLIHGARAKAFFRTYKPEVAARIGNAMAQLDEMVPSYGEFSAGVRRPRKDRW